MQFDYTVDTTQTETRIKVGGEIDSAVADQLADAIVAVLTDGAQRVVVDLTDVWFLDSSGVRALLVGHKFASEHEQTMTVQNPTRRVHRVLDMGGVLWLLTTTAPQ
jgi:anti-anti-sigma factor